VIGYIKASIVVGLCFAWIWAVAEGLRQLAKMVARRWLD
jgi:hypothetical protein